MTFIFYSIVQYARMVDTFGSTMSLDVNMQSVINVLKYCWRNLDSLMIPTSSLCVFHVIGR